MSGTDIEVWEGDEEEWVEEESTGIEVSLHDQQAEIAAALAEATADLARLTSEALTAAEADAEEATASGTALVPSSGTAVAAKRKLAKLRTNAAKTEKLVVAKQEQIRAKQEEVKSLMRKQMALAEEALAPIQKFVEKLQEGIWTVNLYLGRDEEIVVLHGEGEPAPADEPVAIRQLVLAMDEECASNPDADGIDSENIEEFDEWLKADWKHVEQVLPNLKGVVALRPRFKSKQHGDPWKQRTMEELDRRTYFLIRNGERLYRTWTDFNVGERLVPTRDEFSSFFYEEHYRYGENGGRTKIRIPITPGTPAWERAEEAADARQRHFMRVGLILQGLVDRTTVFHPLPEGGIAFTNHEHGGKTWKFISDADMLLSSGRQPFFEWLREKNEQLRVGMRIVGSFTRNYGRDDPWEGRIFPNGAERPPSGERLVIEEQQGKGSFIVRYPRTEKVWTNKWIPDPDRPGWGYRGGMVEPKRRASCRIEASDRNILPFDLVTVEEMEAYLAARLDRHAYSWMFPLLKAAIRAKREEAAEEAPFATMLAGVLARDNDVEVAEAEKMVGSLIEWWKLKNKNHRPLVGSEEDQAKAVRMIVAEHARRMAVARKGQNPQVVARLKADPAHKDALLIARRRDGRYVVITPHEDGPYVTIFFFGARGDLRPLETKPWVLLNPQMLTPLTRIWESERFAEWDLHADPKKHLTRPEFERLQDQFMADLEGKVLAVAWHPDDQAFMAWLYEGDAQIDTDRPLTGTLKDVEVKRVEAGWHRRDKVATLRKIRDRWEGNTWHQRAPWNTQRPDGQTRFGDAENRYVVLMQDIGWVTKWENERARYRAADAERDRLQEIRSRVIQHVRDQWLARREREEFDRFMEEYEDTDLWEGHRKLLTINYPYDHVGSNRRHASDKQDALDALVSYMVETGVPMGQTVWEAASEHFPPLAWFGEPQTWTIHGKGGVREETEQFPEAIDIQPDIRDLILDAPAAGDDDGD